MDFTHIRYGVLLALIGIMFGGVMGLSFGCCEDNYKDTFKADADAALATKYGGDQEKAAEVVDQAWTYMKRAHLHSQTMGVISIAFALLVAWLRLNPKLQMGVSILSGLGSLGYGVFWLTAGMMAPGMGSTHDAKESVALIAQVSGASFFIAGVVVFLALAYKFFAGSRLSSQVK